MRGRGFQDRAGGCNLRAAAVHVCVGSVSMGVCVRVHAGVCVRVLCVCARVHVHVGVCARVCVCVCACKRTQAQLLAHASAYVNWKSSYGGANPGLWRPEKSKSCVCGRNEVSGR